MAIVSPDIKDKERPVQRDWPKRKFIRNPDSLLIGAIWDKYGGVKAVSEALKVHVQIPQNWRRRGRVPLARCYEVANALGISYYGLNYHGWKDIVVIGESWEEVVKSYKLPPKVTQQILRYSHDR